MIWCRQAEPINYIRAIDRAYGNPENEEAYRRQPGDIHIYNPENHVLSDILLVDSTLDGKPIKSVAYDMIGSAGIRIWLPYHYSAKYSLINSCPKCAAETTKKADNDGRRKAKRKTKTVD